MITCADLADIFADHAQWCDVFSCQNEEPRHVLMVVQPISSGNIDSRKNLLAFFDKATMPRGADWGYGLIWAKDAPEAMSEEAKIKVKDSLDKLWTCEAARAVCSLDPQSRKQEIIAWRLALRGKQRMVR